MSMCLVMTILSSLGQALYEPNWESIDSRPSPQWFEDAVGIFIHWVYIPFRHGAPRTGTGMVLARPAG